jgi:hypothetical protein
VATLVRHQVLAVMVVLGQATILLVHLCRMAVAVAVADIMQHRELVVLVAVVLVAHQPERQAQQAQQIQVAVVAVAEARVVVIQQQRVEAVS